MKDVGGTIMEISGLGQEPGERVYPRLAFTLVAVIVVATIIIPRLRKMNSGLGVIKECRPSDRKSGRRVSGQKWCLWDSKGKKVIGRHPSYSRALRQEQAIHARRGR